MAKVWIDEIGVMVQEMKKVDGFEGNLSRWRTGEGGAVPASPFDGLGGGRREKGTQVRYLRQTKAAGS